MTMPGSLYLGTDLPRTIAGPRTIADARACVHRHAAAGRWPGEDVDLVLTRLGITEPEPEPEPTPPPVAAPEPPKPPRPQPIPPAWFTTMDVIDETGINGSRIDYLLRAGHLTHAAVRTPTGDIAPSTGPRPGSGCRRLWNLGDLAAACRLAWLITRKRTLRLDTPTSAAISRLGHDADLTPTLRDSVPWALLADLAEQGSTCPPYPGCDIWRDALRDLAARARGIAAAIDSEEG